MGLAGGEVSPRRQAMHGKLLARMTLDPLSPGLREELVTAALEAQLDTIDPKRVERRALDVAEARAFVIRQAEALVAEWIRTTSRPDPATLSNRLAEHLGPELLAPYELLSPAELLTGILPASDGLIVPVLPDRPQVPLTANELLVNDRKQPSIGSQLKAELQSATSVDLICAFIGSPGMIGGDDTRTRVFFLALRTASPVFRHDARSTPG